MKYVALLLGIISLVLGVASFVPAALADGLLFGIVQVPVFASLGLLAVGALGIIAGLTPTHELVERPRHVEGHDMREWLAH